jgi:dTDP-4-dehydrorhamnose 3,5-epimerase
VGVTLSEENRMQLWIPPGFAHGFYVATEWCEMIYKATDFWAPEWERTVAWNDPDLGIDWPIPAGQAPLLSPKDTRGVPFREAERFD